MIGFRVDANEQIATGHLMRCTAIAMECRRRGQQCLFLMAERKETQRLEQRQFSYQILNTRWDALEGEVEQVKEIVRQEKMDWLVVDSYQATTEYLSRLEEAVPVMYIDDMALEKYPVSALLHYGLYPDLEKYLETYRDTDSLVLAGMDYIPLREEFRPSEKCSEKEQTFQKEELGSLPEREKSILITTGGTDPHNVTGKLLKLCLPHPAFADYNYHVIVGTMNEHEEELQKLAGQYPQVFLHKNVTNMAYYMKRCQMAVSAGGTTLHELCACGTPTVCFSFADNQKSGTQEMDRRGLMMCAGDAREGEIAPLILERLLELIQHPNVRRDYAEKIQQAVDGRGVQRIAEILCSKRIKKIDGGKYDKTVRQTEK